MDEQCRQEKISHMKNLVPAYHIGVAMNVSVRQQLRLPIEKDPS